MKDIPIKVIARVRSDFPEKFGIPRQSGLVDSLKATVVMEPEYRSAEAFRGIEGFSHLWLIWFASENVRDGWSPTVRPPRLGGNVRKGVFATRSPFRPNPICLSCVKLSAVRMDPELGPVLEVAGADLMDGTPILDIKPYHPGADCHPEAATGFISEHVDYRVDVEIPDEMLRIVPEDRREGLTGVLSEDPRPAFHRDPERIYGMSFAGLTVRFRVADRVCRVVEITPEEETESRSGTDPGDEQELRGGTGIRGETEDKRI